MRATARVLSRRHPVAGMAHDRYGLDPKRALRSALTIAVAYMAGGLVPLLPYFLIDSAQRALPISVFFTLLALLAFGYVKGTFTGAKPILSAIQTMLIGGVAAAAAFIIARAIG